MRNAHSKVESRIKGDKEMEEMQKPNYSGSTFDPVYFALSALTYSVRLKFTVCLTLEILPPVEALVIAFYKLKHLSRCCIAIVLDYKYSRYRRRFAIGIHSFFSLEGKLEN